MSPGTPSSCDCNTQVYECDTSGVMAKSFRLDPELERRLERAAALAGVPASALIREAVLRRCNEVLGGTLLDELGDIVGAVDVGGVKSTRTGTPSPNCFENGARGVDSDSYGRGSVDCPDRPARCGAYALCLGCSTAERAYVRALGPLSRKPCIYLAAALDGGKGKRQARQGQGQEPLWRMVRIGQLLLAEMSACLLVRMPALMEQYRDLPMDLADASLVALAEEQRCGRYSRSTVTFGSIDFLTGTYSIWCLDRGRSAAE